MPVVSLRKIMQLGGSKTIALPPGWLAACNLDLGDQALLIADGAVLIVPKGQRLEMKQVQRLVDIANREATKK